MVYWAHQINISKTFKASYPISQFNLYHHFVQTTKSKFVHYSIISAFFSQNHLCTELISTSQYINVFDENYKDICKFEYLPYHISNMSYQNLTPMACSR